ncbi:DUF4893 domain-containing protein [Sphingosinicella sp. CPCC 101087]|uniref:DUF4893 domain-containing protein n=1 Tax=Sphingosinicella sp. CPCC 101087 TaxID=2497754 RepID=UPI00101B8583|nr:DUF4893 domain-containing protein [Sphingosinicella sp. CPCC 101087]
MSGILIAAAFAACAAAQAEPSLAPSAQPPPSLTPPCDPLTAAWRAEVTDEDRRRLRDWRQAWIDALEQARAAGHVDEIAREGALLDPDAALTEPAPPPGDYDCRTIKIGARSGEGLAYVSYPPFHCRIEVHGERTSFTKLTGSQRPVGRLFADVDRRMIFLGTLQLGDEGRAYEYGVDDERDMIGLVERVGDTRWRLVLPYPHFESLLDVIELIPATGR